MVEREHGSPGSKARVLSLFVMLSASAIASNDALQKCGAIEDAVARLACYDAVATVPAPASAPAEGPKEIPDVPPEAPKQASTPPAADTQAKSNADDETWQAKVVRCEKASDGRYFFHLDNGEVWKQVKADRKRYKDCDFAITVTRDWFGYKMSSEDSKRPMRISRIR